MEIRQAVDAMPWIAVMTTPFFFAEVRGYSKLYDSLADGPGRWYDWAQFPLFLIFTDFCIYFIHRGLHHPLIYKSLHKPHHKWIMPTPYASVAFHPIDGFMQSLPYHLFPFIFPLQKFAYLALFGFVQIWTVLIHDGEYVANGTILNGAACHTMHRTYKHQSSESLTSAIKGIISLCFTYSSIWGPKLFNCNNANSSFTDLYFNYNYGQYTTLWDRLLGSYRKPNEELFRRESKMGEKEWKKQVAEMETVQQEVEGVDDRTYGADETKKDL